MLKNYLMTDFGLMFCVKDLLDISPHAAPSPPSDVLYSQMCCNCWWLCCFPMKRSQKETFRLLSVVVFWQVKGLLNSYKLTTVSYQPQTSSYCFVPLMFKTNIISLAAEGQIFTDPGKLLSFKSRSKCSNIANNFLRQSKRVIAFVVSVFKCLISLWCLFCQ